VSLTLALTFIESAVADSTVTVKPKSVLQRIDGFGASDAWYAWEIHWFSPTIQKKLCDALFSTQTGAGLSILRHRVPLEIEPSQGVWDFTQDSDTVWFTKQALARGVEKVWGTVWSPPAWMKSNNDVNNGGEVAPEFYQDYATFLATYVQQYSKQFGVKIAGISIANEPDIVAPYESSNWNSQQFHDFILNSLIPTFRSNKITAQVVMPEISGWTDYAASATLNDPITANAVGIIAAHDYGGSLYPFGDTAALNKTVWETEVSNLGGNDPSIGDGLNWAQVIHRTLVDAHANAWHYWWLFSDIGDTTGQSLIQGSPSSNSITIYKRLWTIGNFSRFVRPGDHMVSASSNYPESGVYVSAFVKSNGVVTVVTINTNGYPTNLTLKGVVSGTGIVNEFRTSTSENLKGIGSQLARLGNFTTKLAPQSVTTFVCTRSAAL